MAIFQKYIHKIFAKKLDIFVIIYLNEILFYIENLGRFYIQQIFVSLQYIVLSKKKSIKAKKLRL